MVPIVVIIKFKIQRISKLDDQINKVQATIRMKLYTHAVSFEKLSRQGFTKVRRL